MLRKYITSSLYTVKITTPVCNRVLIYITYKLVQNEINSSLHNKVEMGLKISQFFFILIDKGLHNRQYHVKLYP